MITKIIRKPRAKADLVDQFAYIAEDNLDAGHRFLVAAEETIQLLCEMPGIGQLRYDISNPRLVGLRSRRIPGFENYLIFYRSIEGSIEIIRVMHGARDLPNVLEEE